MNGYLRFTTTCLPFEKYCSTLSPYFGGVAPSLLLEIINTGVSRMEILGNFSLFGFQISHEFVTR